MSKSEVHGCQKLIVFQKLFQNPNTCRKNNKSRKKILIQFCGMSFFARDELVNVGKRRVREGYKMAEKSSTFNIIPKVLNGGIAGFIGICCVFPLDLVKTRLQKQQTGMYSGIFDAFKKVYKAEGIRGMYRGITVLMLCVTPEKAIKLSFNDLFRYYLRTPEKSLPLWRQMTAGALTGVVQIVVTTPMELIKIQLQDQGRVAVKDASLQGIKKLSATGVALDIIRKNGILGLYKGSWATIARDVPFCVVYFPLFAALDKLGPRKQDGSGEAVFWCSLLAGIGSGAVSALAVTPFDVIKTRIQTVTKTAQGEKLYTSFWPAFFDTWKTEGFTALFKGGACRMLVIAPLYGIVQMVYFLGVAEKVLGIKKDIKI